jgi:hypothetical protein
MLLTLLMLWVLKELDSSLSFRFMLGSLTISLFNLFYYKFLANLELSKENFLGAVKSPSISFLSFKIFLIFSVTSFSIFGCLFFSYYPFTASSSNPSLIELHKDEERLLIMDRSPDLMRFNPSFWELPFPAEDT